MHYACPTDAFKGQKRLTIAVPPDIEIEWSSRLLTVTAAVQLIVDTSDLSRDRRNTMANEVHGIRRMVALVSAMSVLGLTAPGQLCKRSRHHPRRVPTCRPISSRMRPLRRNPTMATGWEWLS